MFHLDNILKGIIHPLGVNKVQKCTVWKKILFYHKRWSTCYHYAKTKRATWHLKEPQGPIKKFAVSSGDS